MPVTEQSLEQLIDLSRQLAEPMPVDRALQLACDAALGLVPADHTSVRLLDPQGVELVSWARAGVGARQRPVTFRAGEGVSGWVCESGRGVWLVDAPRDSRFHSDKSAGFEVRSLVAVPILAGTRVAGVLSASHAQPRRFDERHHAILRLVANQLTPLVERTSVGQLRIVPELEHALASPLRLRLAAELLEVGDVGLSLEEAVVRSGRLRQDVEACLRPMVHGGVVEHDSVRYRLRPDLPREVRQTLERVVGEHAADINRERHIRHHLLGGMIGLDPKMLLVFELVRQVARVDVAVLITGETGTGKELVARAIHDLSPRRDKFFGAVNCATLSESLFESQVFGHARGAFTGAVQDYMGLVERCDKGTLFLDEVGELSLTNQVKLLRFLQEGAFTRLGETFQRSADFRLISATNRDLEGMVAAGSFREDLYYRLAVFPIRIPSLRERRGDLRYLVDGILASYAQRLGVGGAPTLTPDAIKVLERYHWPGNVRELENVMARAVVMAGGGPIRTEHLHEVELLSDVPPSSRPPQSVSPLDDLGDMRTLDEVQRDHIASVLRHQRGNIKATAEILGISRTTLYKKIRDFGIDAPL
jgi:transcriptional regulator with GAF, ATPase, and Fis domain